MPEFTQVVRASDDHLAKARAQRAAEADGVYVLRIVQVRPMAHPERLGMAPVDANGDRLWIVSLLGDLNVTESEARALAGDR